MQIILQNLMGGDWAMGKVAYLLLGGGSGWRGRSRSEPWVCLFLLFPWSLSLCLLPSMPWTLSHLWCPSTRLHCLRVSYGLNPLQPMSQKKLFLLPTCRCGVLGHSSEKVTEPQAIPPFPWLWLCLCPCLIFLLLFSLVTPISSLARENHPVKCVR